MAAALAARLHALAAKPYRLDEITALCRFSLEPGPLVRHSLSFHHMPLYVVLTSWLVPPGLGEGVMRLPAALSGVASCAVLFGPGRGMGGRRSGLAAALPLAVHDTVSQNDPCKLTSFWIAWPRRGPRRGPAGSASTSPC